MTQEQIAKEAFKDAEKDLKKEQVAAIKEVVLRTLRKLDEVKKKIKDLQEEERILKMDIDDLREGRLDRIEERQKKDEKAKEVSVAKLEKADATLQVNPWYNPYKITWVAPQWPYSTAVYCSSSSANVEVGTFTVTGSLARESVAGAYDVSGHVVHLR